MLGLTLCTFSPRDAVRVKTLAAINMLEVKRDGVMVTGSSKCLPRTFDYLSFGKDQNNMFPNV